MLRALDTSATTRLNNTRPERKTQASVCLSLDSLKKMCAQVVQKAHYHEWCGWCGGCLVVLVACHSRSRWRAARAVTFPLTRVRVPVGAPHVPFTFPLVRRTRQAHTSCTRHSRSQWHVFTFPMYVYQQFQHKALCIVMKLLNKCYCNDYCVRIKAPVQPFGHAHATLCFQ